MEELAVLFALGIAGLILVGSITGIVTAVRGRDTRKRIGLLEKQVDMLRVQLAREERPSPAPETRPPVQEEVRETPPEAVQELGEAVREIRAPREELAASVAPPPHAPPPPPRNGKHKR